MNRTPADAIRSANRIAIKVGSSLLSNGDGINIERFRRLAAEVRDLFGGHQIVLVSSGAVALGRAHLGVAPQAALSVKQAAAAIGQPLLMQAWREALGEYDIGTAQLLLTIGDTELRNRWLNARATVEELLRASVVPIVNENDSVATQELRYGDNDRLSARVAQLVGADLLILLSDVDGLYMANPSENPDAPHVPVVDSIDQALWSAAGGATAGGVGTGGMKTKLEAARLAQQFGCSTIIASGRHERPISAILDGTVRATLVRAQSTAAKAYKAWIATSLAVGGSIEIDQGAVVALKRGGSLLPSGVISVAGNFIQGETVKIVDAHGQEVARGIAQYTAHEARQIAGIKGRMIPSRLGYSRGDELIHRSDLVLR